MRYHGNYCGPNWSAGQERASVISSVPHTDEFDYTCRVHDAAYATGNNLESADYTFAAENLATLDPKRMLAGAAVGAQAVGRTIVRIIKPTNSNNKLRGSTMANKTKVKNQSSSPAMRASKANQPRAGNTTRSGNDVSRAAPVAIGTRRTAMAPRMVNRPNGGVSVSHRTFLGPVENSINYETVGFPLNPGVASTFPWLCKIASRYDKYKFTKLRFEYRSVTATSTSGVCMMSFDYNALDPLPASKLIQSQTIPNAENNVWMNNDLVVPCDSEYRFVRQGLVVGSDLKTYDLGQMILSTIYGNGVITGELYVDYTVELTKPSEPANLASLLVALAPAVASPLGTSPTITGIPVYKVVSSTVIEFTSGGIFVFDVKASGTLVTALTPPTGASTTILYNSVVTAGAATTTFRISATKGDQLNWSASMAAATCTNFSVICTEYF